MSTYNMDKVLVDLLLNAAGISLPASPASPAQRERMSQAAVAWILTTQGRGAALRAFAPVIQDFRGVNPLPKEEEAPKSFWGFRLASEDALRSRLIRLAHAKPELRRHLLPLLQR